MSSSIPVVPLRARARTGAKVRVWLSGIVLLAVVALIVHLFATSPNIRWDVVGRFLFDPAVLSGVRTTLELTVLSQLLAIAVGVIIALLGRSENPVAVVFARFYVWFFRAVPLLVWLLFWYNIAILVPELRVNAPLAGVGFHVSTNTLISGFTAAILGLGLHEGAFMAEIIRAGLTSVPKGQLDAALSIGLDRRRAMQRIVLPQALRVIIPPTGNQFIGLLKASALVSAIGGGDLLTRVELIYGQNFLIIPLLAVATIWYLALVSVFSVFQHFLEARFGAWEPR
jgi:polar amino acid transport system permease protein